MAEEEGSNDKTWCRACEHHVHPVTVRTVPPSPMGGTLVTVQRCPGCGAVIA
jgi:hypothetical protein